MGARAGLKAGMGSVSLSSCPECGSGRVWKDGLRHGSTGPPVQRFLCRECGYRFSDVSTQGLNSPRPRELNRQVCVTEAEMINLAEVESREIEQGAGPTQTDLATAKGLLVQFMAWLEKEGYSQTVSYPGYIRRFIKCGVNLLDPEGVKRFIGKQSWKNSVKMLAVYAYDAFTKMQGIFWTPPKYAQEEVLPFVPDEKELDALIASCQSRRMMAFLQTLKETFADPGEALKLRWIDLSRNAISIRPVKGHLPRQLKVSNKLMAMLDALPKTSERIFPTNYETMAACFERVRKRTARMSQNPRIREISFTSFRHWGGTMVAHYTHGNVLKVKELLGHKRIENTMKYIHMINFKDEEFDVATATTVEEAKQILAAGFDYITEKNDIMLFRRPKRFGM